MNPKTRSAEDELLEDIVRFDKNPAGYARYAYPWGEPGDLEDFKGLRKWQNEEFEALGRHLRNPATRFDPFLFAGASGHGIGKSAYLAILLDWGMSTCQDCKVVVTANTRTQLLSKTMPEVAKWRRLSITSDWFTVTAMSVFRNEENHDKTWRADAITWSKNNTEAFAGLHNVKKRIILIFDEASAIDDAVWETAEGALTDKDTEIIWVVFGNPTRNSGRFRECFRKFKHRWRTRQIDSRTVEGTNKKQLNEWVEDHGEDSDFVKIRVRGIFPVQSAKQFMSEKDVDAAFGKHLKPAQFNFAPKILTLDNAWTGKDEGVIGLRQGLSFKILKTFPRNDNDIWVANMLARFEDEEEADAVFIDGGFGTGVVSAGKSWMRNWQIVWFSGQPYDDGCVNKRAEMWKLTKQWLKDGGAIPEDQVLRDDLLGPETCDRTDGKLLLESKADMAARGLPSPNRADSLVLSFAHPVQPKVKETAGRQREQAIGVNYNPLSKRAG